MNGYAHATTECHVSVAAFTRSCLEARMIRSVVVVLVTSIAILCGQHGAGAQARCPLSTMDACDRWHLEQIDQQLAQVVAEAVRKNREVCPSGCAARGEGGTS